MPDGNLRSTERSRQNVPLSGRKNKPLVVPSLPHFVTTSGMIFNVYFSAGPSSQSENTNLAMASSACRHSLRGFADFDADNMPMDWPKQKVVTLI